MKTNPMRYEGIMISLTMALCASFIILQATPQNLFVDDFERGLVKWGSLWTREAGVGQLFSDDQIAHDRERSARIEHRGSQDWSFSPSVRFNVRTGDLFELNAWIKVEGKGSATICVVTQNAQNEVIDWTFAENAQSGTSDWRLLSSRFLVPAGVARLYPRLIGYDPATVWVDDFSFIALGNIEELIDPNLPDEITIENPALTVTFHSVEGTLSVLDRRTQQTWKQNPLHPSLVVKQIEQHGRNIEMQWLDTRFMDEMKITVQLDESHPEFVVSLSREEEMDSSLYYPHPFVSEAGTYLVVPMNEGISYPVDDPTIETRQLVAYGGHGICMPFWGVTDGEKGHAAILETPDDASIRIERANGNLCVTPLWQAQKGQFGYERRIRYIFFETGGHTAICKRYRQYAIETGLFKTLELKRRENPNVDKLIGAVNVWCWDSGSLAIVRDMLDLGIDRILWSNRQSPANLRALNELGILTSRYDIYQDTMNPANFEHLNGVHSDWTTAAWPDDLMLDENGDWRKGWEVQGKDGVWYPCGVLCDKQALKYAQERIPAELESSPYQCRFIDTTTASPWRECYHPHHPMTRSESRYWKMELLRYVCEEMRLVTGSETGHDAAVPFVHYFEGMLSLGPYRVPDAGRNMIRIWDEIPERVAKFQLGHAYRLPLWELVYHDCVVSQWYWGDYNNKLPALWDKRDLFNILYGTPPMFMFTKTYWQENKDRFLQSYRNVCAVAREVGYSEMTEHRFLTRDRSVQQTVFANGITVTVNFGESSFLMTDGKEITAMNFTVSRPAMTQPRPEEE